MCELLPATLKHLMVGLQRGEKKIRGHRDWLLLPVIHCLSLKPGSETTFIKCSLKDATSSFARSRIYPTVNSSGEKVGVGGGGGN